MTDAVKSSGSGAGLSRRTLLATAGAGALALAAGGRRAFADDATIKVGFHSPRTGAPACFGQGDR